MTFEILIGPIASGKSTYCNERAKQGALIVNDDSIVNAVHGNQYTEYKKKFKPLYKGVENFIIHFGAASESDVVIDRPNLNPYTRRRYIELAKSLDYKNVVGVLFKVEAPEVHAKRRFFKDNRGFSFEHWLEAATYQDNGYREPDMEEGFTHIIKYGL